MRLAMEIVPSQRVDLERTKETISSFVRRGWMNEAGISEEDKGNEFHCRGEPSEIINPEQDPKEL